MCEEEVRYKNFIADLLLSSSDRPEREPILIEIYVSHKSSAEKITDGVRIIEVQIRNEEDIDTIVSTLKIDGIQNSDRNYFKRKEANNIFFNFKGQRELKEQPRCYIPECIYWLWMYDSGVFEADKCLINENPMKYIPNDAHYIISAKPFTRTWAKHEFIKRGANLRDCFNCKHVAMDSFSIQERRCTIGKTSKPSADTAKNCQYFNKIKDVDKSVFQFLPESKRNDSPISDFTVNVLSTQKSERIRDSYISR